MPDALASDVTDETQELRNRIAALERERHLLREIFEKSPVMMSIVRAPDFVYEFVNPAFQKLAPGKEFIGHRFADVWSEVTEPLVWTMHNVIRTGRTLRVVDAPYTIQRGPDSPLEVVYISYSWISLAGPDGRPDRILTLAEETTEAVRRQRADRVLKAQSDLIQAVLNQTPACVALVRGLDLTYQLVNAGYQAIAPGTEMLGKTLREVWPDVHPDLEKICARVLRTGEPYEAWDGRFFIRRSPRAAPEEVYFSWFLTRVRLPGEEGWSLLNTVIDTTEQVRAREALANQREWLRVTLSSIGDAVLATDALGNVNFLNPTACRLTGWKEEEALGRPARDVFRILHERTRCEREDVVLQVLREGRTIALGNETVLVTRDGGEIPIEDSAAPIRNRAAELTGVVLVFQDVSGKRRAHEKLRESEERFRVAAQAARFGTYDQDLETGTVYWSPEMRAILGWPADVPAAPNHRDVPEFVHPDDVDRIATMLARALDPAGDGLVLDEHRIVRPDGSVRWVQLRGQVQFSGEGAARRPIRNSGVLLDITERRRAEEERAQQARLKDEFLALLGHELRNPLAAISTAMQLLSKGVTAERRASLDELIGQQVAILRRLVDDLLDLARITHGEILLKEERIDLSELLQRVATIARSQVAARGQEMVLRLPSERVLFMADEVRLEQVLTNLLSNASKYTDRGGRIELSASREGSEVVFRCKDNGRGIPFEMQRAIFEPFTRVQKAGEGGESGVGIGLAVVKRLVELHGGTVFVESAGAGSGSEFTVRLPLVEAPPPPVAAKAHLRPRVGRSLSVVVVEDNAAVAQTTTIALEQAGHRVRLFADGPSALSGLARLRPDAILLDIGLPGMDGYELASRLRARRDLRQTVMIGLSGFKRRAQEGTSRDDFDQYFVKPVDLDELLDFLDTHAGPKKERKQRERGKPKGVKPWRVLLIEDNIQLADLTAEMLRQQGLEVKIAHSGEEALDAAPEFQPDLTLCDLNLPDMSGGEVVRALRSKAETRRTHAVILTAMAEREIRAFRRRAKELGADEFRSKPLQPEAVRDLLAKLAPVQRA